MEKNKVFIIAEIGQAHDGSLGILHSYIDALASTGVDAIKFQTHIAEAESSEYETFRTNFSYEDKTRFDYWKRMSFSIDEWKEIKEHCEKVGVEFMSSPFSVAAVELLESIGMKRYKIGSGEVNNYLMLEKIARTGKPIILSSGMSSINELKSTVDFISNSNKDISILQCTTAYPTPADKLGLNVISDFKREFPLVPIGYSDHSGSIYAGLAAVTMGAKIVEFHTVFDKQMFGPDSTSSLTIAEATQLVEGIRFLETALEHPIDKTTSEEYKELKKMFGKSLAVNKDLPEGHVIKTEDLESKKPYGKGISAKDFQKIIGKTLASPKKKYDFLLNEDLI